MTEPISFRDGTEADLPGIVRLLADDRYGAARENPGLPLDPAYAAGFRRMRAQGGRVLLAVVDDAVVGCLQLHVLHHISQRGLSVAEVEGVRVDSGHRGAGIGRALMRHAMDEAVAIGCGAMQLTSRTERGDAQRFYAGLGFMLSHVGMKRALP